MYKQNKMQSTSIRRSVSTECETIEERLRRVMATKEPIRDGAPIAYGERSEGVIPETDIRTDWREKAAESMHAIAEHHEKKRKRPEAKKDEVKNPNKAEENTGKTDGGAEPIHATS